MTESNVVQITETKRTLEEVQKEAANFFAEAGSLNFEIAFKTQRIHEIHQKLSELNKEAGTFKGENNGSTETK